jgi:endogenous inhibitor of DNA gyrase (YacG/DUF329 family)
MKCPFCDHIVEFGKKDDEIVEYDFFSAREGEEDGNWGAKTVSIKCENCGAQTVVDKESISRFCAFCGSSHIIQEQEVTGIAPESLLPFVITEKSARESFQKWIRKRFFAPNRPQAGKRRRIAGRRVRALLDLRRRHVLHLYRPGGGLLLCNANRACQRAAAHRSVRKIRWRLVIPGAGRNISTISPVPATPENGRRPAGQVEPFPPTETCFPIKPEYLSGFVAERYSVYP